MSLLKVFLLWTIILSLAHEEHNLLTALREFPAASLGVHGSSTKTCG